MSFEAYVQELADPARPLAVAKLVRLSMLGPEERSLFMDAWLQMELKRRQRLIRELTDLAEDNVELNFDTVYFMAFADRDPEIRRNAIKGLWEYEGRDLIDSLLGLLESDPDAGVRSEAALALGRFVLQAEFETLRPADADRVDRALLRAVNDPGEVLEVRRRALEALGARSQPWARDLIQQAFDGSNHLLRLSAVHAMGRSCDASWLPALFDQLESEEPELRYEAAGACGSIADEAATPYLLPLLDDDDSEVQEAAIGALGQIGGAQAKEALRGLLARGGERVREAVLAALEEADFAEDPLAFKVRG